MSVPSFWAKKTVGARPWSASDCSSAAATSCATPASAAFSTVAFSRSIRPSEPTSWLSETATSSPSTSSERSRAARSCSAETGEKTPVTATASALPAHRLEEARGRLAIERRRARARRTPSPPPTIASPAETARRRSSGQAISGGTERVAGAPRRSTATRFSRRRSSTAFVAWVVPSITWVTRPRSISAEASTRSSAIRIPPVTSGVVGDLAHASTASSRSSTTASVFVPPTSMPIRRSGRRMRHLERRVVEVVAEGARARRSRCPRGVSQIGSQPKATTVTRWP